MAAAYMPAKAGDDDVVSAIVSGARPPAPDLPLPADGEGGAPALATTNGPTPAVTAAAAALLADEELLLLLLLLWPLPPLPDLLALAWLSTSGFLSDWTAGQEQ